MRGGRGDADREVHRLVALEVIREAGATQIVRSLARNYSTCDGGPSSPRPGSPTCGRGQRRSGQGQCKSRRGRCRSDRRRPACTSSAAPLLGGVRRLGGRGSLAVRGSAAGDGLGGTRSPRRPWSSRRKEGSELGAMLDRSIENEIGGMGPGRSTPVGLGPHAGRAG
jgi:hypothetical protein